MKNKMEHESAALENARIIEELDRRIAEEKQKTDKDTSLIEDLECRKMITEAMIFPRTKDQILEGEKIAEQIRASETWDDDLNRQLCELAGLEDEYNEADGDTFENVVFKAAEILGVEIL